MAQCRALKISKRDLLACTEVKKVIWTQVPVQQSVTATEMGLGETTQALISAVQPQNKTQHIFGLSLIYSTSEQENPGGHIKNYCGGPHRDIWPQVPTVSSLTWTHGQEELRSAPRL